MAEVHEATFVIVGGGIAGVSCVEQITYLCPDEPVILISASSVVKSVTNLSQISKLLSSFDVTEKDNSTFASEFANLKVIQGIVNEVDPEKREILLENDSKIKYKYLVLCHGAKPKLLPNADEKYVLGIRDTESVEKFQTYLKEARKIVIVGNGGIATELVHELQNVEIVWVIKDSSISATFVDCGAGQFFLDDLTKSQDEKSSAVTKRTKYTAMEFEELSTTKNVIGGALGPDWHSSMNTKSGLSQGKKVSIETECEIQDIKVQNNEVLVTLSNGKTFSTDFIVSATGVIPGGKMIKVPNLELDNQDAIIVNQEMQTNIKGIFAAGDVCSCQHWDHSPHWIQMRLWTQARQMGAYAGTDFLIIYARLFNYENCTL